MASPNATILLSVNSGAFVQTNIASPQGQTAPSAATIQLKGQDITGWQQADWEIFCFPPNWAGPAGGDWSYDSVRNLYVSHNFQPSLITLPAASSVWGKWICRLVVNKGVGPGASGIQYSDVGQPLPSTMLDISGGWQTLSPVFSLGDVGLFEGLQFGGFRAWVAALQTMLRALDSLFGGVAAGTNIQPLTSNGDANQTLLGTTGDNTYPITALTAPRTYTMPTSPTVGMRCGVADARKLYTATNKITLTTAGGSDLFYFDGVLSTLNSGHSLAIDPNLFQGGTMTLTRVTNTTWEVL